jgi:hypothetical protein
MKPDAERCAEFQRFRRIDAAFHTGNLAELYAAVDDPAIVPNGPMPLTIGPCRTLLEIGADPNQVTSSGSCCRSEPILVNEASTITRRCTWLSASEIAQLSRSCSKWRRL